MYLSRSEKERRYDSVRKEMAAHGLDALLIVGNGHATGSALYATGSFRYLSDFFIFSQYGLLLFFRDREPIMLVPMELQETFGRKYSWVEDIRISVDPGKPAAVIFRETSLADRTIGVAGMESLPATVYLVLREEMPRATLVDSSQMLLRLRAIKSQEEIGFLKSAAEINDEAYREVLRRLKPGMREYEVAGILEGVHRGKGADKTFNLVFSASFPVTQEGVPFQGLPWCPGQRAIREGDCVHLEMTANYGGYWNQLVRIISLGSPNAELQRFHQVTVNAIKRGVQAMAAGTKMGRAVQTMAEAAQADGFDLTIPMGHYCGLDLQEGRFDRESQDVLDPGTAFILHPRLDDREGRRIILWGETYLVTPQGTIRLNHTDDTLHSV
jgi:Xaa-Pro dipeptidase